MIGKQLSEREKLLKHMDENKSKWFERFKPGVYFFQEGQADVVFKYHKGYDEWPGCIPGSKEEKKLK